MNYIRITSKDNSLIKEIQKLNSKSKYRREKGEFVLEGLRLIDDAANNSVGFLYLLVTDEFLNKFPDDVKKFAQECKSVCILSDSLFSSICQTTTPQGIMAVAKVPNRIDFLLDEKGKYIALENVQDPANLGAVARTAEALGIKGIFVSSDCCDIYSPKVLRASMGTVLRLPVIICDDLLKAFQKYSLKSFACVVHGDAACLGSFDFPGKSVCVIGNEANGLSERMINGCDERITVRMSGRAESLNAAAAASIVMWEMISH